MLFMGLARLGEIAAGLVAAGLDPQTPAAVISAGTTPAQETVVATVATIAAAAEGFRPPALIVVGHVVALSARVGAFRGEEIVLGTGLILSPTPCPT